MSNEYSETIEFTHICNWCGSTQKSRMSINVESVDPHQELPKAYEINKMNISLICPVCEQNGRGVKIMSSIQESMVDIVKKFINKGYCIRNASDNGLWSHFVCNATVSNFGFDGNRDHNSYLGVVIDPDMTVYYLEDRLKNKHFSNREEFKQFEEFFRNKFKNAFELYDRNKEYNIEELVISLMIDHIFENHDHTSKIYYLFGIPEKPTFRIHTVEYDNCDYTKIVDHETYAEDTEDFENWIDNLPDLNDLDDIVKLFKKCLEYDSFSEAYKREICHIAENMVYDNYINKHWFDVRKGQYPEKNFEVYTWGPDFKYMIIAKYNDNNQFVDNEGNIINPTHWIYYK